MPELPHRADPRRPGRHRIEPRPDGRFDQPTVSLPAAAGSAGGVAVLFDQASAPDPAPARARHRSPEPVDPAETGKPATAGPTSGGRAARRASAAAEAKGAGSRHRHTQPLPVVPEDTAPGRHQAGTSRHRSTISPRRPVGRSLVGALAVIGVVGGVELTAASLTGAAGPDTASGPSSDPATLSGLHTLAPQFTPTRPGPDDRRPAAALVPEPRQAADDRIPDQNERDDRNTSDDQDTDGDRDTGDERPGSVRADGPGLPDLPGLGLPKLDLPKLDLPKVELPGLLPKPKPKAVSTANCGKPGKILNLANWKLTLPTGSSGDPTEIVGSALSGLTNKHFGTGNRCDAVAFRAPVNGTTTKGSKNPRSELREMTGSGSGKAGWSSSSGTHTMTVREAFTRLPSGKPHLVGAQIHDASDDVSVFRLEGTKLWVTNGDNPNFKLADANYKLGTPFEAKFVVSGGQTRAFYNGKLVATIAKSYSGAYFKAGAYTQANCGNAPCSSDNYGETLIYDLDVRHT